MRHSIAVATPGEDELEARELVELREHNAASREELERLRGQLAEARARQQLADDEGEMFRAIFEHSSDAILLFDESGIIDCNQEALRVLRCADKDTLLQCHPAVFSPELQPDGRRSMDKSVDMDRTARERGWHRFEWMHRRLDGELFPVEVTLTPLQLARGSALLVVWHDLSEFKAREQELEAQLELIRAQQAEMRRMSMPVISVGDGVVMVPVLGELDEEALGELADSILGTLDSAHARTLILDLTGLARASTETAASLGRLLDAAALLGVDAMMVGIQPSVAREFVSNELALPRAQVLGNMRDALRQLGARR